MALVQINKINLFVIFKWVFCFFLNYFFILLFIILIQVISADEIKIKWYRSAGNALKQQPEFYGSEKALHIADVVLLYQRENGGWPKNYDRTTNLQKENGDDFLNKKNNDTSFDNGSTHSEVRYLAKVYNATGNVKYKHAFLKGVEFILEAQYKNGGWPQFYPDPIGYQKYITFNDNAMIGIMIVLQEMAHDKELYPFISEELRIRCKEAVARGVQCILKTQIVVDDKKTGWCSQYDENTLIPRGARSYELISISGYESVGIVKFLMGIDNPDPEIIEAIQEAITWFNASKIQGIRQNREMTPLGWGKVVVRDTSAPPMWARFYDINTNQPLFSSRDGVPKNSINEISFERRNGYSWLGYYPASLLDLDYPVWQKKWAPSNNVLKKNNIIQNKVDMHVGEEQAFSK